MRLGIVFVWVSDRLQECGVSESDNLGSTDSEVKKILTLHLPISEYDTLGSDSEGEDGAQSQELVSFRHRLGRGESNIFQEQLSQTLNGPQDRVQNEASGYVCFSKVFVEYDERTNFQTQLTIR